MWVLIDVLSGLIYADEDGTRFFDCADAAIAFAPQTWGLETAPVNTRIWVPGFQVVPRTE